MKSIMYLAVLLLLVSCGETKVSQEDLVKQIKDKSNVNSEIYIEGDSIERVVYFYYVDGELGNFNECDSATVLSISGGVIDTTVCHEKFHLEKGQIYIIDEENKLFNQEPFDNIVILSNTYSTLVDIDPFTMQAIFVGWEVSDDLVPTSLKPNITDNAFDQGYLFRKNSMTYKAFKVERNGLWGLMNFDGELLAPVEYTSIELNDNGKIKLYKGEKLEKEIVIE